MFRGRDSEHGFELWRSDGTHAGTSLVKEINHRGADTTLDAKVVRNLTRFGGEALLPDADEACTGSELWRSDGSADGTFIGEDINAPAVGGDEDLSAFRFCCPRGVGSPMVSAGGKLYFVANDGEHGHELWSTNGARRGARPS